MATAYQRSWGGGSTRETCRDAAGAHWGDWRLQRRQPVASGDEPGTGARRRRARRGGGGYVAADGDARRRGAAARVRRPLGGAGKSLPEQGERAGGDPLCARDGLAVRGDVRRVSAYSGGVCAQR